MFRPPTVLFAHVHKRDGKVFRFLPTTATHNAIGESLKARHTKGLKFRPRKGDDTWPALKSGKRWLSLQICGALTAGWKNNTWQKILSFFFKDPPSALSEVALTEMIDILRIIGGYPIWERGGCDELCASSLATRWMSQWPPFRAFFVCEGGGSSKRRGAVSPEEDARVLRVATWKVVEGSRKAGPTRNALKGFEAKEAGTYGEIADRMWAAALCISAAVSPTGAHCIDEPLRAFDQWPACHV
ncbi:hypothetical protein C8R46DRAFT_1286393 [Mycena filopes]|nr:hypothetical protein C8R46DRAFT_1286393 [Mycena filopes]